MKRRIHIVLALLLALQPLLPLWAAGGGCEMAQMHSMHDGSSPPPCAGSDCCDETDCLSLCQAFFANHPALVADAEIGHIIPSKDFDLTTSGVTPPGHLSRVLRPPIAL